MQSTVPIEIRGRLEKMEDKLIITKDTEPTLWVNSLVKFEKLNGELRLCLDPKDLNKVIQHDYHQLLKK